MNNLILDDHYSMKDVFIKGDLITKLSFVFSGLNNLRHKQLIKGFSFLNDKGTFPTYLCHSGDTSFGWLNLTWYANTRHQNDYTRWD